MNINVLNENGTLMVTMNGEFVFRDNQAFKQVMHAVQTEAPESVTVDLRSVSFMDSAAMGMLLLLRDAMEEKKGQVTLRTVPGQVQKVLELCKFEQLFKMAG